MRPDLDPSGLRLLSLSPSARLLPVGLGGRVTHPSCPLPPLAARGRGERKDLLPQTAAVRGEEEGAGEGKSASSPGSPPCKEALGKGREKSLLSACRA